MSLSASVKREAKKSAKAEAAIDELKKLTDRQIAKNNESFTGKIKASMTTAGLTDGYVVSDAYNVKIEYLSEFSLEKVAKVVTDTLKAAAATQSDMPAPLLNDDTLEAYCDVVNSVAEASKSSSSVSASQSYTMTHMCPGYFVFLYAASNSVSNTAMFGSEAVTSTAIFHRIVQSPSDFAREEEFNAAAFEAESLERYRARKLSIFDDVMDGRIDRSKWAELDSMLNVMIEKAKGRLERLRAKKKGPLMMATGPEPIAASLVTAKAEALKALDAMAAQGGDMAAFAAERRAAVEAEFN